MANKRSKCSNQTESRQIHSKVLWDAQGNLPVDFLENLRVQAAAEDESTLKKLTKAVAEKCLRNVTRVLLHHDNVPVHFYLIQQEFVRISLGKR